jgi:hypothetical protein
VGRDDLQGWAGRREVKGNASPTTAAAALLIVPAASACDRLWLAAGGELWLANEDGARLLVADAQGIQYPRWSPEGKRIAYAHPFRFEAAGPRSEILVVTDEGRAVARLPIPPESEVNAVLAVGWRGARNVFAEGHVNPSTTKYLEWDVRTGRLVDEKVGSWFAVSPDGRFVAQRAHVPHGAPAPYDSAILLINENRIYPAVGDESYHRFAGRFAWSPDSSRLAIIDQAEAGPMQVVILNAHGEVVLRAPLTEARAPRELSWSTLNALDLRDGETVWRLDTSTGAIERMRDLPFEPVTAKPPSALRQIIGDVAVQPEDIRCKP